MTNSRKGLAMLPLARAAAKSARPDVTSDKHRTKICRDILFAKPPTGQLAEFAVALSRLPVDERHYWTGTFYTLLLDPKLRKEQATYFTPPELAEIIIDMAVEAGFDIAADDVLDPAAGGAAFLSTLAGRVRQAGIDPEAASYRLNGLEIDRGLAALSRILIADRLGAKPRRGMIVSADALRTRIPASYDLVIANPPYGRMSESCASDLPWRSVCHPGHINKYALFVELCLRHAKPGGIVALVIPSSFRAGPLFATLREHIRCESQVLAIGTVGQRNRLFVDVAQDVSVLILRKGEAHKVDLPVTFHEIGSTVITRRDGLLPRDATAPWSLPNREEELHGGHTLSDWGAEARSGYFVWNRQLDRLVCEPGENFSVPLIWAKNVRPGHLCRPSGKSGRRMDFVTFEGKSRAIIRQPAVILQRTTNEKQPRRLLAATVDPRIVSKWGGFTTENHTIALTTNSQREAELLCQLLNTDEVDRRYRKVSGTAAISVALLRGLDLPSPARFSAALSICSGDADAAARAAYAETAVVADA